MAVPIARRAPEEAEVAVGIDRKGVGVAAEIGPRDVGVAVGIGPRNVGVGAEIGRRGVGVEAEIGRRGVGVEAEIGRRGESAVEAEAENDAMATGRNAMESTGAAVRREEAKKETVLLAVRNPAVDD